MPPAVDYVEIGTDGEEVEYAEYTIAELEQRAAAIKAEMARLVPDASEESEEDIVATE